MKALLEDFWDSKLERLKAAARKTGKEETMSETYELTREIVIDASPETVFSFLTEEAKMKQWFGEVVESDPDPAACFMSVKRIRMAITAGENLSKSCRTKRWCLPGAVSKI